MMEGLYTNKIQVYMDFELQSERRHSNNGKNCIETWEKYGEEWEEKEVFETV